jgi:hypothetical protein
MIILFWPPAWIIIAVLVLALMLSFAEMERETRVEPSPSRPPAKIGRKIWIAIALVFALPLMVGVTVQLLGWNVSCSLTHQAPSYRCY